MNPKVKANWISALNSGEYKQGTGRLKGADGSFCCLGVLCDLYSREMKIPWDKESSFLNAGQSMDEIRSWAGLPPEDVRVWAGLPPNSAEILSELTYKNDKEGKSFNEIAEFIKEIL